MTDDEPDADGRDGTEEDRPTVTVPTHMSGDEVVESKEVDAEWWEHTLKARDVNEQVSERYRDTSGVIAVGTARGNDTIGGLYTHTVQITVVDEETADSLSVPEEIDGIPISVRVGQIRDLN